MCGIAGILNFNQQKIPLSKLNAMTEIISHRGPDGFGQWSNPEENVLLGHRRLSIIDLSTAGHQPMSFGHLTITFNGEIYNYIELKKELTLKGYQFKTESDTEVLLMCYHLKGASCLKDLEGMFSFAIWDDEKKQLFCARDRFGEKPFYYTIYDNNFIFGSEIKQLFAFGIKKEINESRLFYYAATGNITDHKQLQQTYYKNICQLPHSHYAVISFSGKIEIKKYWDIDININYKIKENEAVERFSELLANSIQKCLRSDVPVGTSLSGGLDSTTIASYICRDFQPNSALNTFTATFKNFEKDESKYIKIFSEKYSNINSYFVEPSSDGFFDELDKLFFHHDEPIGSTSIYAQYKVMELARKKNITVLLDGQGADEYLGGYNKYWVVLLNQLFASKDPSYIAEKQNVHNLINFDHNPGKNLKLMLRYPGTHKFLSKTKKIAVPSKKTYLPKILNTDIQEGISNSIIKDDILFENLNDTLKQSTLFSGLQELLRFADRNSMAHSREVRLPFLSHELVEFAFTLPSNLKMQNGWSKYILRSSQTDRLPKEICWRKEKIGYETPQVTWFKTKRATDFFEHIRSKLYATKIFDQDYLKKADNWTLVNMYYLTCK